MLGLRRSPLTFLAPLLSLALSLSLPTLAQEVIQFLNVPRNAEVSRMTRISSAHGNTGRILG